MHLFIFLIFVYVLTGKIFKRGKERRFEPQKIESFRRRKKGTENEQRSQKWKQGTQKIWKKEQSWYIEINKTSFDFMNFEGVQKCVS